jgi:hypothetical protein
MIYSWKILSTKKFFNILKEFKEIFQFVSLDIKIDAEIKKFQTQRKIFSLTEKVRLRLRFEFSQQF